MLSHLVLCFLYLLSRRHLKIGWAIINSDLLCIIVFIDNGFKNLLYSWTILKYLTRIIFLTLIITETSSKWYDDKQFIWWRWEATPWKKLQVGDIVRVSIFYFFLTFFLFFIKINANLNVYVVAGETGHLLSSWFATSCKYKPRWHLLYRGLLISSLVLQMFNMFIFYHINIFFMCQTANLDGETNLKIRKALEKTWDYVTPEKASEFKGFKIEYLSICLKVKYFMYFDLYDCRWNTLWTTKQFPLYIH